MLISLTQCRETLALTAIVSEQYRDFKISDIIRERQENNRFTGLLCYFVAIFTCLRRTTN